MIPKTNIICFVIIASYLSMACNNNPKVITASNENESTTESTGVFSEPNVAKPNTQVDFNAPFSDGIHKGWHSQS